MCKCDVKDELRWKATCELMGVCLKINGLGERKRELTGDMPTVFFQHMGHTAELSIDVHSKGWCYGGSPDKCYRLYLDKGDFWEKYLEIIHGLFEILEC